MTAIAKNEREETEVQSYYFLQYTWRGTVLFEGRLCLVIDECCTSQENQ